MLIDALLNLLLRLLRIPWVLHRSPRARAWAGLACILVLTIAVNVLAADDLPRRFDVTQDRLYTLSAATTKTLARIDEPITLRFYYTPRLGAAIAGYRIYAERVRALLEQYAAAAHGRVRLQTLDPEPRSTAAAGAVSAGLRTVPIDVPAEYGFFGLVGTNSTDDRAIVALFDPARERRLEYDLTRLVYTLALPDTVAVSANADLAALRRRGAAARPLTVIDHWRQQGAARPVERLEAAIAFVDIAPAPILVAAAALTIWRRRRSAAAG